MCESCNLLLGSKGSQMRICTPDLDKETDNQIDIKKSPSRIVHHKVYVT